MEQIVRTILYVIGPDGITPQPLSLVTEGNANDGEASLLAGLLSVENHNMGFNGLTWDRLRVGGSQADANPGDALGVLDTNGYGLLWNGASWDRARTPVIFKSADITVASALAPVALWTPTAGKRFRLMGYRFALSGNATAAAAATYSAQMFDAATALPFSLLSDVPAAIVGAVVGEETGAVQLGNGYLSAAINNVLNVTPTVALTNGVCRVWAWGTEE